MCGNHTANSILKFWHHVKTLPAFQHHDLVNSLSDDQLKKTIPFTVHADGCEFFSDQEFFAVSWSSSLGAAGAIKDVLLTKFPILVIAESHMLDDKVREGVNQVTAELVAWSLECAASGKYPTSGFRGRPFEKGTYRAALAGQPLAGEYRMAYFTFKADLKARKECHLFKNYYLCKRMCDRCAAIQPKCPADTNHPMVFKDMRPTAPYRTTTVSHAEYLRTASRISPWAVVKGWSLETTSFDLMHMIFLGIARDYVPSCLKILRLMGYHYEPGETDEEFLRRTSWEMKLDCKSYGIYVPRRGFTVANCTFYHDEFPELGSRFKASHIKQMTWWLSFKLQKLAKRDSHF
ncbi:unnamed protein product [Durusdinium trenchii]|uniref:Uncharacterized protein n=1 Tax=Durusdinium trenchii TaxID=1381693 RepID=A0ABP0Q6Y7_9DINO